ncbi:hypothetical protein EGI32_15765 [Ferruginibacter sp. HRS2-29]|nr:hypothetical protein [Ferruginibacter sp. HRS2-29]
MKGIADFKGMKGITQIILLAQNGNAVYKVIAKSYKLHFHFLRSKKVICVIPCIPLKSAIIIYFLSPLYNLPALRD